MIVAWFTVGGIRDLRRMYAHLERYAADARDDGTVAGDAAAGAAGEERAHG